jgi:hypothetical protein
VCFEARERGKTMSPDKCPHCDKELPGQPLDDGTKLAVLGYIRNRILGVGGVVLVILTACGALLQFTVREGWENMRENQKKAMDALNSLNELEKGAREAASVAKMTMEKEVEAIKKRSVTVSKSLGDIEAASRQASKKAEEARLDAEKAKTTVAGLKLTSTQATQFSNALKEGGDAKKEADKIVMEAAARRLVTTEALRATVEKLQSDRDAASKKAAEDRKSIRSEIDRKVRETEAKIQAVHEYAVNISKYVILHGSK